MTVADGDGGMAMPSLPGRLIELLKDPASIKVLSTTGAEGAPHAVVKGSLTTLDDRTIALAEELDSSVSNKNLVRSIWFDRTVAVCVTNGALSYQIKGKPYRCLITGPVFKELLRRARERRGADADIAAVWIIKPLEVRDESPGVRRRDEEDRRPFLSRHLDRDSVGSEPTGT